LEVIRSDFTRSGGIKEILIDFRSQMLDVATRREAGHWLVQSWDAMSQYPRISFDIDAFQRAAALGSRELIQHSDVSMARSLTQD
jgi:hypothetical protein